jgi:hypothetical protein
VVKSGDSVFIAVFSRIDERGRLVCEPYNNKRRDFDRQLRFGEKETLWTIPFEDSSGCTVYVSRLKPHSADKMAKIRMWAEFENCTA